jgi:peptidoglycan/LPS O-acetylase OafA/YrhL
LARTQDGATISRFYLLDVARGIASMAVVLWHYQHFYYVDDRLGPTFDRDAQPFFFLLKPLYLYGSHAVDLFFVLSGFVFFSQYLESIGSRQIGPWRFFVLRFSRLYPLNFVTLLLVAGLQLVSQSINGKSIVYSCNDVPHFILNLFFMSNWGCFSFNGPVWSVSLEVLLYISFFIFALIVPSSSWARLVPAVVAGAVGVLLTRSSHATVATLGIAIVCFYAGGIVFLTLKLFLAAGWRPLNLASGSVAVLAAGAAGNYATTQYSEIFSGLIEFPALVMALAAVQYRSCYLGRQIRILGDITYSTYLTHFPIQLALLLAAKVGLISIDYNATSAFIMFFVLLIAISIPTYYFFEMKAQNYLRKTLSK